MFTDPVTNGNVYTAAVRGGIILPQPQLLATQNYCVACNGTIRYPVLPNGGCVDPMSLYQTCTVPGTVQVSCLANEFFVGVAFAYNSNSWSNSPLDGNILIDSSYGPAAIEGDLIVSGVLDVPFLNVTTPTANCRNSSNCEWTTDTCPTNFIVFGINIVENQIQAECCPVQFHECVVPEPVIAPFGCGECRVYNATFGCVAEFGCRPQDNGACINGICVQCEFTAYNYNSQCSCPQTIAKCTPNASGGCTTCVDNSICSSGTCTTCPSGTFADPTLNQCVQCNAANPCSVASNALCQSNVCVPCPSGTWADLVLDQCVECNAAHACPTPNSLCLSNNCLVCPSGTWADVVLGQCVQCNQAHPCSSSQYCNSSNACVNCNPGWYQSSNDISCCVNGCPPDTQWSAGSGSFPTGCYCSGSPVFGFWTQCPDTGVPLQSGLTCGAVIPDLGCQTRYSVADVNAAYDHNSDITIYKPSTVNSEGVYCHCSGCILSCQSGESYYGESGSGQLVSTNVPKRCSFSASATTWESAINITFTGTAVSWFDCSAEWFVARSVVNYNGYATYPIPFAPTPEPPENWSGMGISWGPPLFQSGVTATCSGCYQPSGDQCYLCQYLSFARLFPTNHPTIFEYGCFTDDIIPAYPQGYQCDALCVFVPPGFDTSTPYQITTTVPTSALIFDHYIDRSGNTIDNWCQTNNNGKPYIPNLQQWSVSPTGAYVATEGDVQSQTGWCVWDWRSNQNVCCGQTAADGTPEPQRCWIPYSTSAPNGLAAQQSFLDVAMCCMTEENVSAFGADWIAHGSILPNSNQLNIYQCVQGNAINSTYYNPSMWISLF